MNNHKKLEILFNSLSMMLIFYGSNAVAWNLSENYYKQLSFIFESQTLYSLGVTFLGGLSLAIYIYLVLRNLKIQHYVIRLLLTIAALLLSLLVLRTTIGLLFGYRDAYGPTIWGVEFLWFSSIVLFAYLFSFVIRFSQKLKKTLLLLCLLSLFILAFLSFSTAYYNCGWGSLRSFTDDDGLLVLLTGITGFITAVSGLLAQFTARKKIALEMEIERQKLALEREKLEFEKRKLSRKKK